MRKLILAALLLAPALAAAGKHDKKKDKPKVKLSGFVQVFFKQRFDSNGDGQVESSVFRVMRARVELKGAITPRVSYDLEIDPRAPLITGVLRDAFIRLDVIPHHQIRIGQQKTQFGYENPESSTHLYVVNRAEVSDNLSRGINERDIGVGVLGDWPVRCGWSVEDAITVVNGAGMNVQADDTGRKNVWGRVGGRFEDGDLQLRFGVSGAWGNQKEPLDPGPPVVPAFVFDFTRLGADLEVDHPYAFAAAELVRGWDDGEPSTGGYLLAAGKTPWHAGPVARYDALEAYHRWTLGGYWGEPKAKLRVMAEYEIYRDDLGAHDHKIYLWTQARF